MLQKLKKTDDEDIIPYLKRIEENLAVIIDLLNISITYPKPKFGLKPIFIWSLPSNGLLMMCIKVMSTPPFIKSVPYGITYFL